MLEWEGTQDQPKWYVSRWGEPAGELARGSGRLINGTDFLEDLIGKPEDVHPWVRGSGIGTELTSYGPFPKSMVQAKVAEWEQNGRLKQLALASRRFVNKQSVPFLSEDVKANTTYGNTVAQHINAVSI